MVGKLLFHTVLISLVGPGNPLSVPLGDQESTSCGYGNQGFQKLYILAEMDIGWLQCQML